MEVSLPNKTNIIVFILDEAILKLWNISKGMRKRLRWMLKKRSITISSYDQRALVFNGWVRQGAKKNEACSMQYNFGSIKYLPSEFNLVKGISNYWIRFQEQLEILASLKGEIRCFNISIDYIKPTTIQYSEHLFIGRSNFEYYSKCSFKRIGKLCLRSLSSEQIKIFLTRVDFVDTLTLRQTKLSELDLGVYRITNFEFDCVEFCENVILPSEAGKVQITKCQELKLLKQNTIQEINFKAGKRPHQLRILSKEDLIWIKKSKGLKCIETSMSIEKLIFYLPMTIRKLVYTSPIRFEELDLNFLKTNFHYLICVSAPIPIGIGQYLGLRDLKPIMLETKDKFTFRPRKIRVNDVNVKELNKHPELFENVESVVIWDKQFDFDILPKRIKKLWLCNADIES